MLPAVVFVACAGGPAGSDETFPAGEGAGEAAAAFPRPSFHHIHVNSVDPERALDWWSTFWPAGERTTLAGMPAFAADGVYLQYCCFRYLTPRYAVSSPTCGGISDQGREVDNRSSSA